MATTKWVLGFRLQQLKNKKKFKKWANQSQKGDVMFVKWTQLRVTETAQGQADIQDKWWLSCGACESVPTAGTIKTGSSKGILSGGGTKHRSKTEAFREEPCRAVGPGAPRHFTQVKEGLLDMSFLLCHSETFSHHQLRACCAAGRCI